VAQAIATYAGQKAAPHYTPACGHCAKAVREAIEFVTGKQLQRTESAKDYGSSLLAAGWNVVGSADQLGDVIIMQPPNNQHPHGHMQVCPLEFSITASWQFWLPPL
jgi:hypothetical protein